MGDAHGGGQVAAVVDVGGGLEGGLGHQFDQAFAGGADAEDCFGSLDKGAAHGGQGQALVFSADDLNDALGGERFERGDGGFGDGGDGVVEKAYAERFVNQLQTVGKAGEVGDGALGIVAGNSHQPGGRVGGLGVGLVVPAGENQLEGGAIGCGEWHDPRGSGGGEVGGAGVVGVEHGKVVGALESDDVFLCFEIGVGRAMPIEMIVGQHRHHAHVRGPAHGGEVFEHEAGEFENDQMGFVDLVQFAEQRPADVAADPDCVAGLEHFAEEGGGGGFALAAGDAEDGGGAAFDEEADFGGDGNAGVDGGLEKVVARRNGGGGDDQIGLCEILEVVLAEMKLDGQTGELLNGPGEFFRVTPGR